jgi:hypothetical protein
VPYPNGENLRGNIARHQQGKTRVPANRSVAQSNFDMVKAKLLQAQNRVGQLEPGEQAGDSKAGDTHSWPNIASLLLMGVPSGPTQSQ